MKIINENVELNKDVKAQPVEPFDFAVADAVSKKHNDEINKALKDADKLPKEESDVEREHEAGLDNPQLKKLNLDEGMFDDVDIYDNEAFDELTHMIYQAAKKLNITDHELITRAAEDAINHLETDIDECIKEDINTDDIIDDIANRYTTSHPVSGNWDTELDHELLALQKELNISEEEAKDIMINRLGFNPEDIEARVRLTDSLTEAKRKTASLFDRVMVELDKQAVDDNHGPTKRLLNRPNSQRYDSENGEIFAAIDDDGITVAADDLTFAQEVADAYDLDTKDTMLGDEPALTILIPMDDEMELPR